MSIDNRFGLSGARLVYAQNSVTKYMHNPYIQAYLLKGLRGISTPAVFDISTSFYTMARVRGDNLVDHLIKYPGHADLLYPVLSWIYKNIDESTCVRISLSRFYDKMDEIHKKCPYVIGSFVKKKLYTMVEHLDGTIEMPIGQTHGDPTLENIMVRGDVPVLIDPIPSFIDSPLIDLSKLLQDILYRWHICRSHVEFSKPVYDEFRIIIESIRCLREWKLSLRVMELMTIARILPYCKNREQVQWCQMTLSRI